MDSLEVLASAPEQRAARVPEFESFVAKPPSLRASNTGVYEGLMIVNQAHAIEMI